MKRRSVLLSGVALSGTALANDSIFFSPLKYLGRNNSDLSMPREVCWTT